MKAEYRYIKCAACKERIYLSPDDWHLSEGKFYCMKKKCVEEMNGKETKL